MMRALLTGRPRLTLRKSLLLSAAMALTAPGAWALDLHAVLENTAVSPPARVSYREERHNRLLENPIVLTGYLEYLEAGVLRKVVETPFEEAFLIESDYVVIERGGETRKLPLRKSKSLTTILGAIEAIISGDKDKLEVVFNYELSGTYESWSILLTPKSRRINKHLTSLQVTGDDQSATSIRINLNDGEWQLMEIFRNDRVP